MLVRVVKQKTPYVVDGITSIQEFLMSDQLNVNILHIYIWKACTHPITCTLHKKEIAQAGVELMVPPSRIIPSNH